MSSGFGLRGLSFKEHSQKEAFHEPPGEGTGRTGCRPGPLTRRVERFMVPMHAEKRKGALHEPTVRSPGFSRSGPPEGRTPNKRRPHGSVHGPNARQNEWRLPMNRSAELQFGTAFCVRRAAILPNRSSALHPYSSCCGPLSKQTLAQLRQSPGAMAYSVFHLLAQLGE